MGQRCVKLLCEQYDAHYDCFCNVTPTGTPTATATPTPTPTNEEAFNRRRRNGKYVDILTGVLSYSIQIQLFSKMNLFSLQLKIK